jgi:hypothetical protein
MASNPEGMFVVEREDPAGACVDADRSGFPEWVWARQALGVSSWHHQLVTGVIGVSVDKFMVAE